eukprot:scaffold2727_cov275-Chaetoceros_neogracile.AAC.10
MMLWKKNRSINTSAGSLVPGANQGKTSNIEEVFHEGGGGFTRLLIIAGVFLVLGLNIGNTHRNIMEEENTFKLNIFELEEDNSMRKICPSANNLLVDNMNSIKSAHGKAEEFHNKGGNLKVLEKFLNANIDNTYRNTGAKFVPDGKDEPLSDKESIKDYIANAKRVNDKRLRGGYGDRSNYGTFQSLPNHISHRKDEAVIDVKESLSNWERWKTGMGPIAVDLCKNVTNIISGIEKKMICSLDNSFVKSSVEKQEKELSSGIDVVNTKDAGKENKCSIMSIGSNGQWGFEKYIVESSSCETHTFDCTVKDPRKPRNDNVHFYPYCISHENKVEGGKEYLTYSQMMDKVSSTCNQERGVGVLYQRGRAGSTTSNMMFEIVLFL